MILSSSGSPDRTASRSDQRPAQKTACRATVVPWGKAYWAKMFERFGGDPLPYGLTPSNRTVIDRLARHLQTQGFIPQIPATDAVFATPAG